jgi:DnaJ-domain-containing protein 1
MRFFRKREPADPFGTFSERYGVRLPEARPEEAPPEPEDEPPKDEPPKDEPESAGPLWAHSALGVGLGASQKEISAAYRRLARVHHPDVAGDEERMKWINAAYRELRR